ncbi:MAG: diphthine synthase [Candidatus Thermoplasmatota archaeon]|nr:diphthine synthase [Candidatus Thermoplasmatota archaeon]MCL5438137.1 diphthine synthase [Candidatus Thermoplasmatota archaeon]
MTLRIIGLGLRGFHGLSMEAVSALESSDHIFLDTYTSITDGKSIDALRKMFPSLVDADREMLENPVRILELSGDSSVSIIVVGDPLSATTHNQLRLDAMRSGISTEVFPSSSIITYAPAASGLLLYRMGPPVSLPFTEKNFFPTSVYRKIARNHDLDLHTLVLLDLREGKTMPVGDACSTLKKMEEAERGNILEHVQLIVVSSAGSHDERIVRGSLRSIEKCVFSSPSCIIIPAILSEKENEFVEAFTTHLDET